MKKEKGGAQPPSVATDMETIKLGGKTIKFKKGALHRQLKIPEDTKIGMNNLNKIIKGEIGSTVMIKGKSFKITNLMKKRAVFGKNIQRKK